MRRRPPLALWLLVVKLGHSAGTKGGVLWGSSPNLISHRSNLGVEEENPGPG